MERLDFDWDPTGSGGLDKGMEGFFVDYRVREIRGKREELGKKKNL